MITTVIVSTSSDCLEIFQGHVAVVNSLIVKGENVDATTNVRTQL